MQPLLSAVPESSLISVCSAMFMDPPLPPNPCIKACMQVPPYTVRRTDDGVRKRLIVEVSLPGIASGAGLVVSVLEPEASLFVRAPGRYRVTVPLELPISGVAESVKFVRDKSVLKVTRRPSVCRLLPMEQRPANFLQGPHLSCCCTQATLIVRDELDSAAPADDSSSRQKTRGKPFLSQWIAPRQWTEQQWSRSCATAPPHAGQWEIPPHGSSCC